MALLKTLVKWTLLFVILAGFVLSPALILDRTLKESIPSNTVSFTANTVAAPKQKEATIGLPVRLRIPTINVDAALDYVGLTPLGALGVPDSPTNAAWYDQGPRPGEEGSAVIDGHFGYKNHRLAVFDNLYKLHAGDILYVEDAQGTTTAFVVRELRTYGRNEDDTNVFVSNDGKAHLNLITCQGVWSATQKSFSNRLVVFTDEEV
jgi:LPXTG-site transpeptidase (sortase) family protein